MARTNHAKQISRLRTFLVISSVTMSVLSLVFAFVLSFLDRSGNYWFLLTAVAMVIWATVTATCERVSASDALGIVEAIRNKSPADKKATKLLGEIKGQIINR